MALDRPFFTGLLRDWGVALLVAAVVFVGWSFLAPRPPSEGEAPEISLVDFDGNPWTLSELRGKTVVLNFWATWCGPCVGEIPEFSKFQAEHPDVVVVGISVDEKLSAKGVQAAARRLGILYTVLHDKLGVASEPYRVNVLPTTFVIGADGGIDAMHQGTLSKATLEHMVFD